MTTLAFGDFIVLSLINLALLYFFARTKRSAELSAEEGSKDREHLKKIIREAVSETRDVLAELRVHGFRVVPGKRRLARMNALIEKLSLGDVELGNKVWSLVNVPIMLLLADKAHKLIKDDQQVVKYKTELEKLYFKDLEWAMQRCAKLEKNPLPKKRILISNLRGPKAKTIP